MARMVKCVKLGQELPGLDRLPMRGELGQRIYDHVSQQAWQMWMQHSVIVINHYGLSLGDPQARAFLEAQMEDFFFGDDAAMPEGWTPEDAAPSTKGAPQRK